MTRLALCSLLVSVARRKVRHSLTEHQQPHSIPLECAYGNTDGPSTQFVFMGIEINTNEMALSLPQPKLDRLKHEIVVGDLDILHKERNPGQLPHVCQGPFLRRMIELFKGVKELCHKVRLNVQVCSYLRWWGCFLPT